VLDLLSIPYLKRFKEFVRMVTFLIAQSFSSERYRRSASVRVSTAIHMSPPDMG
jgi:hypothetical protein